MPESPKYKNWKVVTEADFVSLFIKTWFAYISTLRVMFPEAQNRRGDGKYINEVLDDVAEQLSKLLEQLKAEKNSFEGMGIDFEEKAFYVA